MLSELLHDRVSDEQRATVLSVESLLFQAAGAAGGLGAGVLVRTTRVLRPTERFTDGANCR